MEEYPDEINDTLELDDIEPIDQSTGLYEHFRFTVDKGQTPIRIDKYLFERIVNASRNRIQMAADGGYILVGVDNDGRIVGVDINNSKRSAIHDSIGEISPALNCELSFVNIGAKSVYVLEVPNGKHKPYICSGSIWIRKGSNSQKLNSIEEIRGFFQECDKIFFDSMSCQEYGTDINTWGDAQTIDAFRTEARLSPQVPAEQIFENCPDSAPLYPLWCQ